MFLAVKGKLVMRGNDRTVWGRRRAGWSWCSPVVVRFSEKVRQELVGYLRSNWRRSEAYHRASSNCVAVGSTAFFQTYRLLELLNTIHRGTGPYIDPLCRLL